MPEDDPAAGAEWEALVDALYSAPPEGFVATRDDAVRAARERGDRAFATAAARLRRPTRAAWLANLLARRRPEQLEGLLGLAGSLADAQRTLDGPALRALSAQRRRLVTAMAREAGQLAREAHEPAGDGLVREVGEILEAALADPVVADEVRSGRLTRTVSYTGFGLPAGDAPSPAPGPPAPPPPPRPAPAAGAPRPDGAEAERRGAGEEGARRREEEAARRRDEEAARRREQEARRAELADAERDEQRAHERRDAAEAARDTAVADHAEARDRVTALTAELEAARERERDAAGRERDAVAAARAALRDAGTAATRTARARARLEEVG